LEDSGGGRNTSIWMKTGGEEETPCFYSPFKKKTLTSGPKGEKPPTKGEKEEGKKKRMHSQKEAKKRGTY